MSRSEEEEDIAIAIRGYPKKIYSDPGSQLVGASKELAEMFSNLKWSKIEQYSTHNELIWYFSLGDAPWYNGCCEALIRQ